MKGVAPLALLSVVLLAVFASCTAGGPPGLPALATPDDTPVSADAEPTFMSSLPTLVADTPAQRDATDTPSGYTSPSAYTGPSAWMTADDFPIPPDRDLTALARQLRWKGIEPEPAPHQFAGTVLAVGAEARFWILDSNRLTMDRKLFRLAAISDSAYWWVEHDLSVDDEDLEQATAQAEQQVFPRIHAAFGSPAYGFSGETNRLHIVNGRIPGVGGYVSGADAFPATVAKYSNEITAIYINANARSLRIGSDGYLSTVAHELQHVIHEVADTSESTWLNEGLSELAATEAGLSTGSAGAFLQRPNTSLVNWPSAFGGEVGLNYGAASLFAHYLREHYIHGEGLAALLAEPADGMASIDAYLATQEATTNDGHPASFNSVFADWVLANMLDSDHGVYGYANLDVNATLTRRQQAGDEARETALAQFAADYWGISGEDGNAYTVHFEGSATTSLLPTQIPGGSCWWSNRGDSISSTLTGVVSVPQTGQYENPPSLDFLSWFEIEENWDYTYVEISEDGGATWDVLPSEGTTDENPVGNSFGPGYTGSRDWQRAEVSLHEYAGRQVMIRFHYVTDDAIHGPGFCVRDIRLPGDGPHTPTDWRPDGFVRVNNNVAQDWIVWVISDGTEPTITRMGLTYDPIRDVLAGSVETPASETGKVIVVVAPVAPATAESAIYRVWAAQ
jgi:immune inhibitor A